MGLSRSSSIVKLDTWQNCYLGSASASLLLISFPGFNETPLSGSQTLDLPSNFLSCGVAAGLLLLKRYTYKLVGGEALKPPVITIITFGVGPKQSFCPSQHGVLLTIYLLSICLNHKTVHIVKFITWQRPLSLPHMQRGRWLWEAPARLSWLLYLSELDNVFIRTDEQHRDG